MRVVVIGCGRVGAILVRQLVAHGHTVGVVDVDPLALERLGEDFPGQRVVGTGIDEANLLAAGLEGADGLAAVTDKDNVNLVAGQLAREKYHVPVVVARVYDPKRQEVYEEVGIHTISFAAAGADLVYTALTGREGR